LRRAFVFNEFLLGIISYNSNNACCRPSKDEQQGLLQPTKAEGHYRDFSEEDPLLHDVRAMGKDLSPMLATVSGRWIALAMVSVACFLITGPLMTWATYEPVLVKMGVFNGSERDLDNVFSSGSGIVGFLCLPVGILYDVQGPKFVTVMGAIAAAVGLLLMSLGLAFHASWALYPAFTLASGGGAMASYALYPFAWLLPEQQNFINALSNGLVGASGALAFLAVCLYNLGVPLEVFFAGLAVGSLASAVLFYYVIPSREEYEVVCKVFFMCQDVEDVPPRGCCKAATSTSQNELQPPTEDRTTCGILRRTWNALKQHPHAHALYLSFNIFFFQFFMYINQQIFFYERSFLSLTQATDLADTFALVTGIGGLLFGILGGCLTDTFGFRSSMVVVHALIVVQVAVLLCKEISCQWAAQLVLTFMSMMFYILVCRAAMLYASPQLFGTISGLYFAVPGLFQLFLSPMINELVHSLPQTERYTVPFIATGSVALAMGIATSLFWWVRPPPMLGGIPPS